MGSSSCKIFMLVLIIQGVLKLLPNFSNVDVKKQDLYRLLYLSVRPYVIYD